MMMLNLCKIANAFRACWGLEMCVGLFSRVEVGVDKTLRFVGNEPLNTKTSSLDVLEIRIETKTSVAATVCRR